MTTMVMVQTVPSTWICLEWNTFKVAVTSNSLAKQNSFRKPLVLTQTNDQNLQRTLKRERKTRISLFSNLQIPINFLLSLLFWHIDEPFITWFTIIIINSKALESFRFLWLWIFIWTTWLRRSLALLTLSQARIYIIFESLYHKNDFRVHVFYSSIFSNLGSD